jgi:hypothetical protein
MNPPSRRELERQANIRELEEFIGKPMAEHTREDLNRGLRWAFNNRRTKFTAAEEAKCQELEQFIGKPLAEFTLEDHEHASAWIDREHAKWRRERHYDRTLERLVGKPISEITLGDILSVLLMDGTVIDAALDITDN